MRDQFRWARILSFVTGLVNQELLLRNEYLPAENRILRAHLPARLRLSDAERSTLAEIAKRLGRKALQEIARQDRFELPGFSTSERITKHVLATAQRKLLRTVFRRLTAKKRKALDQLLATAFVESRSTPKQAATSIPARWSPTSNNGGDGQFWRFLRDDHH
jgi:hypothetical protein